MKKNLYIAQHKCLIVLLSGFMSILQLNAQEPSNSPWTKFQEKYQIKTSLGFQFWSTYTTNQFFFDQTSNSYVKLDNRWNTQLRRSRLSVSGQPYQNLSFKLTASLDLIGRDALSATQGGNNNGNVGQFGLWNAWIKWQPWIKSDLVHITTGFQPLQIGRESITSALRATSFEKSWSQNYMRRTIVGRGSGRTMGFNIGGQTGVYKGFTVSYDLGAFSPQSFSSVSNSQGVNVSPLLVGRFSFHIGQPESPQYTTSHKINYFGERNGLTIALAASHQGHTDFFDRNQALGFDWLLNFKMFNLDGEYTYFSKEKTVEQTKIATKSTSGYIRVGYNVALTKGSYLEPLIMFVWFNGPLKLGEQQNALILNAFAGSDRSIDFGLNYHLNPKFKISLTYTLNQGDLGESPSGVTFNNFYSNSNNQAIQRGDFVGVAFVAVF